MAPHVLGDDACDITSHTALLQGAAAGDRAVWVVQHSYAGGDAFTDRFPLRFAAGVLLASSAAIGAAGTASAATPTHLSSYSHHFNRDDYCGDW
ncbi:hypothetical protein [Streptomyces bungoensis]|uniref:hypothetical protein n=1 Tax=Streptomyces bungoensis TaxID=285568 RepID=UPI003424369A